MAVVDDYTALLNGTYWYPGAPAARGMVLTYSFSSAAPDYYATINPLAGASFQPFSEEAKELAREAMRQWAAVSGVTFIETTQHIGDITFGYYDMAALGTPMAAGSMFTPVSGGYFDNTGTLKVNSGEAQSAGDIRLSTDFLTGAQPSWFEPHVLLHEIGHALGLAHPHDGPNTLAPSLDNGLMTVMSYNAPRQNTLGMLDQQAIQALYGASQGSRDWNPTTETLTTSVTASNQFVRGTNARDIVFSTGSGNAIVTTGGDDIILATGAKTEINAGTGNDIVYATGAGGAVYAEAGNDLMRAEGQSILLFGGEGVDTVITGLTYTLALGGVGIVRVINNERYTYISATDNHQSYFDVELLTFFDGHYDIGSSTFTRNYVVAPARTVTTNSGGEGASDTQVYVFDVTRQTNTHAAATVTWFVPSAGANPLSIADTPGGAVLSGTLDFAAGETRKEITITSDVVAAAGGSAGLALFNVVDGKYRIQAAMPEPVVSTPPASSSYSYGIFDQQVVVSYGTNPDGGNPIPDTTALPPSALALATGSDTGSSTTDRITKLAQPTIQGNAEPGATVSVSIKGATPDSYTLLGTVTLFGNDPWSFKTPTLSDGTVTLVAHQVDAAGNVSALSEPLTFTVDTTPPAPPSAPDLTATSDWGVSDTDNLTGARDLTVVGTAEPDSIVTLVGVGHPDHTTKVGADGSWSITFTVNANRSHVFTARATDAAGNVSADSAPLTVISDQFSWIGGPPELVNASDTGVSNIDNLTRIATPVIRGTAEAGATISLFSGNTLVGTTKVGADQAWSITTNKLTDGVHVLRAQATDDAGYAAPLSPELTITIDTTPPPAPSLPNLLTAHDSGRLNIDNVTSHQSLGLIGHADPGLKVTLFSAGVALGSGVASAAGVWSIQTPTLAEGKHTLFARATDAAGNSGAWSPGLAVAVDRTAPGAAVLTHASTSHLVGTADPNARITVLEGGKNLGSAIARVDGGWTLPVTLSVGTHALTTKITDLAGNEGADGSVTVQIGTTGADALAGVGGTVLLIGGAGDDTYDVDDPTDLVREAVGEGLDTIRASASYRLAEGAVVEFLRANASSGGVSLTGNGLNNTIIGGAGDDEIVGGKRMDTLTGGAGADIFRYLARADSTMALDGRDLITDFSIAEGDRLDLSALDANAALAGDQAFTLIGGAAFSAAGQIRFEQLGGKTVVIGEVTGDGVGDFAIRLAGSHAMTADWFVL